MYMHRDMDGMCSLGYRAMEKIIIKEQAAWVGMNEWIGRWFNTIFYPKTPYISKEQALELRYKAHE